MAKHFEGSRPRESKDRRREKEKRFSESRSEKPHQPGAMCIVCFYFAGVYSPLNNACNQRVTRELPGGVAGRPRDFDLRAQGTWGYTLSGVERSGGHRTKVDALLSQL